MKHRFVRGPQRPAPINYYAFLRRQLTCILILCNRVTIHCQLISAFSRTAIDTHTYLLRVSNFQPSPGVDRE